MSGLERISGNGRNLESHVIRPMTITDYEQARQLWMSCAGMGLNDLDDSSEGMERFLARNPETCFIAEIGGKVVGTILCGNDGRRGYVYHAAVDPDYRNQGIAADLVQKAMKALKALGISKAALVVLSGNSGGNAFWERMGFVRRDDLVYRSSSILETVRRDA